MSIDTEPGFKINGKVVGLLVGLTSLLAFGFQGVGWANNLQTQITQISSDQKNQAILFDQREKNAERIVQTIEAQNEVLIDLRIAVKSLEAELKMRKP